MERIKYRFDPGYLLGRSQYHAIVADRIRRKNSEIRHWDFIELAPPVRTAPVEKTHWPGVAETFQYSGLTSTESLRLVKALPSTGDGHVQIEVWEPQQSTPYLCLSYTWGDPSEQIQIRLNGYSAFVRRNLFDFLQVAARRFAGEAFWIDALCINQANSDEKGQQIQRMGTIYANATEVLIWLGHDDGIAALFDWLNEPRSTVDIVLGHISFMKTPMHLQRYVLDLAKHPYWRRAWVRQEMMMAKTLRLACGLTEVYPDALERCIRNYSVFSTEWHVYSDLEKRLASLKRPRTLSPPEYYWGSGRHGEIPQCDDPRDRIYSLLSVIGQETSFPVDYGESVVTFFWRLLYHFAPELEPVKVERLWTLLDLTPSFVDQNVNERGERPKFGVPMRRTNIVADLGLQLWGACRLTRSGLCGHDTYGFARARIHSYSRHDILLCPGTVNGVTLEGMDKENIDLEGLHVLLHPRKPLSEDCFTFSIFNTTYGQLPQPEGTELWSKIDGVESLITTWSEVLHVADLGGYSDRDDHDWQTRPHFTLKLPSAYFVECVDHVQKFWLSKRMTNRLRTAAKKPLKWFEPASSSATNTSHLGGTQHHQEE